MARFQRRFSDFFEAIAKNVFTFCKAMNFTPTWQQQQLLGCVQRGDLRIAVRSGQGPGKTTASCLVGIWRAIRSERAMTILTAPTMRQCTEVWLAEARRLMSKADPMLQRLVSVTRTKVVIAGDSDWGVKTVTATKEENAQGFHERNMTIICEEASGIPREIVQQFEGTASNPNCLFLQIGNPNTRDCAFFDCFNRDKHHWTTLHWNAEQTPASEWFDPARNTRLADKFGLDSDVYRIRVLGDFPSADPNCVLSTEMLEPIMDRTLLLPCSKMLKPDGTHAKQFGMDFARFGGDENTMFRRSGNAVVEWEHTAHEEPVAMIRRGFRKQGEVGWNDKDCWYIADAGGMGQGCMFVFHEAGKTVLEFHNGGRAVDSQQYDNKITEAWFGLAELAKARRCYLPFDSLLEQQLTTRRYYVTKKGKLILESKDEYIKRGHDSPDRADGAVLAMYNEAEADSTVLRKGSTDKRAGAVVRR